MVFNSPIFVFYFLPVVLLVYYFAGRKMTAIGKIVIFLSSYLFYGWLNPWFVVLIFAGTLINYVIAPWLKPAFPSRKLCFILALGINLGLLIFFKYVMFFQHNINILIIWGGGQPLPVKQILLPVGISFYTFKSLSYLIDVYRGNSSPERSFLNYAGYAAFFPQVLSGPIQRYGTLDTKSEPVRTFAEQIKSPDCSVNNFSFGAALFILGFAKKVFLSNVIANVADTVFTADAPLTIDAWYGALGYSLQLYIDFSSYSEMAIGLGLILGFACPRNFNAPYLADSISDFWRRWHISLSSWFRDYLYIPLGGNRGSSSKTYFNLIIVFFLCGLWHGANWTFIAWGIYHGIFLVIERALGQRTAYAVLPKPVRILFTFFIVTIGWVLFRADTFAHAFSFLACMFGFAKTAAGSSVLAAALYTREHLLTMALCVFSVFQPIQAMDWAKNLNAFKIVILVLLFGLSLMTMFVQSYSSFLYFKF